MAESCVLSVARSRDHSFSKAVDASINLLEGLGVEGDCHAGVTVQHLSRIAKTPGAPNLRQVHLIHTELHEELLAQGFVIEPGQMGENITTRGIDLLNLPTGTRLKIGESAVIKVTGLRNPCKQLNDFHPGLMQATLDKCADGTLIRKAGVMAVVQASGTIQPGNSISVELPDEPYKSLEPV